MSIVQLEVNALRKLYDDKDRANAGFKIYNVLVLPEYINLTKGKSTIVVSGVLPDFEFNEKVALEVEEVLSGKYAGSYKVKTLILDNNMFESADFNENTLKKLGYSEKTIHNILQAYPKICNDIINHNPIDYKNIKGCSETMYNKLVQRVLDFQQEFQLMLEFKEFNFSFAVAKNILHKYSDVRVFKDKFEDDAYKTLCSVKGLSYKSVDKILLEQNPSLRVSLTRSRGALSFILEEEEKKGSSYVDGNYCYKLFKELIPECKDLFMEAIQNNYDIYVNYDKKIIARMSTFEKEKYIANKLLEAHKSYKRNDNFNPEKYHSLGDGNVLSKKQQEILSIVQNSPISILCGYAGCGKAQPLNSLVLTTKGFRKMKNIKVGTKVFGEDGKPHKVIGVYPQGKKKVYRVYFHDKKYTECTEEHLWTVTKHQHFSNKTYTLELKDLFEERLEIDGAYKYSVPVCEPIQFKEQRVYIQPSILGRFLNGEFINKKDYLTLTSLYGVSRKFSFIPEAFLKNSIQVREELLKSLMPKYVVVNEENKYYEIKVKSAILKNDIECLIYGLGKLCVTIPPTKDDNYYYIRYSNDAKHRFITDIKYIGEKKCQCIEVNNPTQLYITDNFIVTHNTFSIKSVTRMLADNGKNFELLAPTGRASKVLKDNTDCETSTIHRNLMPLRNGMGNVIRKMDFVDFVICDESTMIDINLMFDLLNAIDLRRTSLLFVCDPAQLLSVGCGNILTDMINSKVFPTVSLDEVFRYDEGGISYVATKIRNGSNFLADIEVNEDKYTPLGTNNDYLFYYTEDDNIMDVVTNLYVSMLNKNGGNLNGLDIVTLSAYNKGKLGVGALNENIQSAINPQTEDNITSFSKNTPEGKVEFRINDKVIQTVNNYKATTVEFGLISDEIDTRYLTQDVVFNGEDGYIVRETKLSNGEPVLIIRFEDRYFVYKKEDLISLSLGYAITIHKSQGSSFKNVIVVSPNTHKYFTTRNLLYVACTRARERVIQVGSVGVIRSGIRNNETTSRNTFLEDLLKEEV